MATPQSVRYLNEMRALNALFRKGALTRSALARHLGLNRSSIGHIVDDLIADGLAREREVSDFGQAGDRQMGRPGVFVEINPEGGVFLGVEIGVDHITVVAIDMAAREILSETTKYSTGGHIPDEGIAKVAELLNAVIASFRDGAARIKGVCVAIPALVRDGVVRNGLMLGWRDVKLRGALQRALTIDVPVVVENDANAFAIGETYRATSLRADTVAFLLIENGAGGGIVIGGHLFRGAGGFAGEFGQIPVCGETSGGRFLKKAPLESYIGKDAVLASYTAAGAQRTADLDHFLEALRRSDPAAAKIANDWGDWLARGLISLTNVLNPGLIILGGSMAPIYTYVETRVQAAMRREFLEGFPMPAIELSKITAGGAALGGACLLHQNMFSVDESLVHGQEETADRSRDRAAEKRRLRRASVNLRL